MAAHLAWSLPVQTRFNFSAAISDSESSLTKSMSQSEQRVNPGRYSALHSGQNMTADDSPGRFCGTGIVLRLRWAIFDSCLMDLPSKLPSVPINAETGHVEAST